MHRRQLSMSTNMLASLVVVTECGGIRLRSAAYLSEYLGMRGHPNTVSGKNETWRRTFRSVSRPSVHLWSNQSVDWKSRSRKASAHTCTPRRLHLIPRRGSRPQAAVMNMRDIRGEFAYQMHLIHHHADRLYRRRNKAGCSLGAGDTQGFKRRKELCSPTNQSQLRKRRQLVICHI